MSRLQYPPSSLKKKPRFWQKRGFCLHAKDTDTKLSAPAARYRSGKSRQAKGSRVQFRHGKSPFIVDSMEQGNPVLSQYFPGNMFQ